MQLSNSEEQVMEHLWKLKKKLFFKRYFRSLSRTKAGYNNFSNTIKKNDR